MFSQVHVNVPFQWPVSLTSNLVNRVALCVICLESFEMNLQVLLCETSCDENGPVCLLESSADDQEMRTKSWDSFKSDPRNGIQLHIGGIAFKIY